MGIVAICPNGHRMKVKDELAGRKGICPTCAARFRIPTKAEQADAGRRDGMATGPATARVVSRDPLFAASLPAAFALDDAETVVAAPSADAIDAPPDFVLVDDEPATERREAVVDAAAHWMAGTPAVVYAAVDERPDLAWCVAVRGGAPSTPLDAAAMRTWLDSGSATADHVVWRQDWAEWRPLTEVFPEAVPQAGGDWP